MKIKNYVLCVFAMSALLLTSCNDGDNTSGVCNDCDDDTPIVCEGNECDDDPPVDCEGDDCDDDPPIVCDGNDCDNDNPVDCEGDDCDDDTSPIVCENNCGDIPLVESLAWTRWRYVGVGDVETGILTDLVDDPDVCGAPCSDCYTIMFSDVGVHAKFFTNSGGGSYYSYYNNYTTDIFPITDYGVTMVHVVGCREYVFFELNRATSFSLQENKLKIYYDENKYLLFEPFKISSLRGTNWKLIGIIDGETCSLQELEGTCNSGIDCLRDRTYSLNFMSDTRLRFFTSDNESQHFDYDANYTTRRISIQERDVGMINDEIGDGDLLLDILPTVGSFSFEEPSGHKLRLYYNECNSYLLFRIHR